MNWSFLLQNLQGPTLVPATSPRNSNQFEFLGEVLRLVPQNASCELFPVNKPLAISRFV